MITKTFENVKEDVSKDFQTKKFRIAVRPVSTVMHIDITDQAIFVINYSYILVNLWSPVLGWSISNHW